MLNFKAFLLLCVVGVALTADSDITKFMKHLEVIPDLIAEGPKDFLKISWDSGVFADKGVELTPTQVKNEPKVEWKPESGALYTLIMTDPDAPSRADPKWREWHHWIVGNIPGNDVSKGEAITQYVGSGAPKDTGLHRYTFLLYKQPKKLKFDEKRITNKSAVGREKFSTTKFAEKYGLGVPVAGNFFQAQYDDYVPVLYKQMGV